MIKISRVDCQLAAKAKNRLSQVVHPRNFALQTFHAKIDSNSTGSPTFQSYAKTSGGFLEKIHQLVVNFPAPQNSPVQLFAPHACSLQ